MPGPVALAGHSAGGQIVTRLAALGSPLTARVRARLRVVASISGLHDLRPLLLARMNETLRLDEAEALAESPIALWPDPALRIVCTAGEDELPEFRRQSALLASVWHGLGAPVDAYEEPGRHHFDIVDLLADPSSRLTRLLTGAGAP